MRVSNFKKSVVLSYFEVILPDESFVAERSINFIGIKLVTPPTVGLAETDLPNSIC